MYGEKTRKTFFNELVNFMVAAEILDLQIFLLLDLQILLYLILYVEKTRKASINELVNVITRDTYHTDFLVHRFACKLISYLCIKMCVKYKSRCFFTITQIT